MLNSSLRVYVNTLADGEATEIEQVSGTETKCNVSFKSNTSAKAVPADTDLVLIADTTGKTLYYTTFLEVKAAGTLWTLSTNELYPDNASYNVVVGASANSDSRKFLCVGEAEINGKLIQKNTANSGIEMWRWDGASTYTLCGTIKPTSAQNTLEIDCKGGDILSATMDSNCQWNGAVILDHFGGTGFTSYTQGDILYASAADTLAKLAKGTDNYILKMNGNVPNWEAEPTIPDLTTSYNFGTAVATSQDVSIGTGGSSQDSDLFCLGNQIFIGGSTGGGGAYGSSNKIYLQAGDSYNGDVLVNIRAERQGDGNTQEAKVNIIATNTSAAAASTTIIDIKNQGTGTGVATTTILVDNASSGTSTLALAATQTGSGTGVMTLDAKTKIEITSPILTLDGAATITGTTTLDQTLSFSAIRASGSSLPACKIETEYDNSYEVILEFNNTTAGGNIAQWEFQIKDDESNSTLALRTTRNAGTEVAAMTFDDAGNVTIEEGLIIADTEKIFFGSAGISSDTYLYEYNEDLIMRIGDAAQGGDIKMYRNLTPDGTAGNWECDLFVNATTSILGLYGGYISGYTGRYMEIGNSLICGSVAYTICSDDRLKTEEKLIENATDMLMKLRPQTYMKAEFMGTEDPKRLPDGLDINKNNAKTFEAGLISQEIYYECPELRHIVKRVDNVKELPPNTDISDIQNDPDWNALGWSTDEPALVSYTELIPYLIKSNQEQQAKIDALEAKMNLLINAKSFAEFKKIVT